MLAWVKLRDNKEHFSCVFPQYLLFYSIPLREGIEQDVQHNYLYMVSNALLYEMLETEGSWNVQK